MQVTAAGGRLWRLKYRSPAGIEKKLALGAYPDVGLKAARELRDEAWKLIASDIHPAEKKQRERHAARVSAANSFASVSRSFIHKAMTVSAPCRRRSRT